MLVTNVYLHIAVPTRHRTDRMSAAVNNLSDRKEFTARYESLLAHYGMALEKINARQAHENGDVEQSHRRSSRGFVARRNS